MAKRPCAEPGCPTLGTTTRCPAHTKTTTERGYGSQHQIERAKWQQRIDAGEHVICWRPDCDTILTGRTWHLGHDDHDRSITRGPECTACNLHHAGKARHRTEETP